MKRKEGGGKKQGEGIGIEGGDSRGMVRRLEWVKEEEEDELGRKRDQRAWGGEKARVGSSSIQSSRLLLVPQVTKHLQAPQPLVIRMRDGKVKAISLGVPSFPSIQRPVSTEGRTAPWPRPDWAPALPSLCEMPGPSPTTPSSTPLL